MVRIVSDDEIGLKVLREPHNPPEDSAQTIDIVAIHGIGAHPDDSWSKNIGTRESPQWVNWLEEDNMLPALVPNARIMRYGYRSQWFGERAMRQKVSTIAPQLLGELAWEREDCPSRPLIFIAHCFGGLVVLKALIEAPNRPDEWPNISESTTGILFFGTPFRGAEGMSQDEMLQAALMEYAEDEVQMQVLQILDPGNEMLQYLVDQFTSIWRDAVRAQIACFYETASTDVGKVVGNQRRMRFVVSESSGCLDQSDSTRKYGLDRTHFNMNKFGKPSEQDFRTVGRVIKRMAGIAHELILARNQEEGMEPFRVTFSLAEATQTEHFIARDEELIQIHEAFCKRDGRRTAVVHGLGGIGKTQLAIEYAVRHRSDFSAILWFNIKDVDSVKQSFARAARRIAANCPSSGLSTVIQDANLNEIVRAVKQWLDRPKNTQWLLVFDNYDNPKLPGCSDSTAVDILQFLPESYHGSVLITSRLAQVKLGCQIRLNKLRKIEDSLRILSDASGRRATIEDTHAATLVRKLDGLPLALATAGSYLNQVATSFADYLAAYEKSWLQLQQKSPQLSTYDRALYSTWQLSFNQIQQRNELSTKLLKLWAYFDNHDLWFELLKEGYSKGPEWLKQLTEDAISFTDAIRLLCDYGLVEVSASAADAGTESKGYSIHACVHEWMNHVLNKGWDVDLASIALACVASHVPEKTVSHYSITQQRLALHGARCVSFILNRQIRADGNEWALHNLGLLYGNQGKLDQAEQMYDQALQGYQKALGAGHRSTLNTLNNLGLLYTDQGRLEQAEQTFERVLQGKEKTLGIDHKSTLETITNLGNLYAEQGKLDQAERMYQQALQGKEKMLGADHTSVLDTVHNLGSLYWSQGKLDNAEQMFTRALQGKKKTIGIDHTSTLDTINNLGNLYWRQGKLDHAERMYQQALQGKEKVLGGDHISVLNTLNDLGSFYWSQRKLDQAEQMYDRALQGYEKIGPKHITLDTINNLGGLYADQGKLEQAEQMLDRALRGYQKTLGARSLATYLPALNTAYNLGVYRAAQNRTDEARAMYSVALTGYQTVFGKDHAECREVEDRLRKLEHPESNSLVSNKDPIQDDALTPIGTTELSRNMTRPSRRQRILRKLPLAVFRHTTNR